MKRNNINIIIAVSLIVLAVIARIVNSGMHLHNYVPIAAIGLFSGSVIKDRRLLAFFVPLAGQFIADLYFQLFTNTPGFYPGEFFNYAAIGAAAGLGMLMKQPKPASIVAYLFGASLTFFIISNFGFFLGGWNGYSFAGLGKTYIDAIPFFKNTLIGDMLGGIAMFGGYFITQMLVEKNMQKAKA